MREQPVNLAALQLVDVSESACSYLSIGYFSQMVKQKCS